MLSCFVRPRLCAVLLAMVCGLALAACGGHPDANPTLHEDARMAIALDRAASYTSTKVLRGDEVWMAKQGAWLLGGEFEPWADQIFVDKRVLQGQNRRIVPLAEEPNPWPEALPVPEVDAVPDPIYRMNAGELARIRKMMDLSIDCRKINERQKKQLLKLIERPGRSYVVTHQLWALVTSLHDGCVDRATFDRLRPKLATAIYAELLADTVFHDLMAERMAMLCYAGLVSWIPDSAFEVALETQDPTGGWIYHHVDIGPHATSTVMHMSTLAFYALASKWSVGEGRDL
jgi:hypothetical protein